MAMTPVPVPGERWIAFGRYIGEVMVTGADPVDVARRLLEEDRDGDS